MLNYSWKFIFQIFFNKVLTLATGEAKPITGEEDEQVKQRLLVVIIGETACTNYRLRTLTPGKPVCRTWLRPQAYGGRKLETKD